MVEASVALDARVAAGSRARRRARRSYAETPLRSEILRRHHDGAPHVRRGAGIPAEAFLRLPEVAAHHVRELLELHLHGGIERVEVVDANQARAHVPLVLARVLVVPLDVRVWLVVGAEELDVHIRVSVPDRLVREESQRLVIADRPRDLFVHVGLEHLRRPVAVIAADEAGDRDVVQQAGEHELLGDAVLLRQPRALHEVVGRAEAVLEEVEQRGPLGHPRQARILVHHHQLAVVGPGDRHARVAIPRHVDHRLHDRPVQLLGHGPLGRLRALQHAHGVDYSHDRGNKSLHSPHTPFIVAIEAACVRDARRSAYTNTRRTSHDATDISAAGDGGLDRGDDRHGGTRGRARLGAGAARHACRHDEADDLRRARRGARPGRRDGGAAHGHLRLARPRLRRLRGEPAGPPRAARPGAGALRGRPPGREPAAGRARADGAAPPRHPRRGRAGDRRDPRHADAGAAADRRQLRADVRAARHALSRWYRRRVPTATAALLIDDDARLGALVTEYLGRHEIDVTVAADGQRGLGLLRRGRFDVVLLDVMLPGADGFEVCRRLRATPELAAVPVIMLTARGDDVDKIVGLELGADDYLAKPFNPRELLARIHAVLRRGRPVTTRRDRLRVGRLEIDFDAREVTVAGRRPALTAYEFELLAALARAAGRVLSRDQLLDALKGAAYETFDRSIDVHISKLRAKLETNPKEPRYIKTVRGAGYVLSREVD